MNNPTKSFTTDSGDVREDLTDKELDALFSKVKRLNELPSALQSKLRGAGRPAPESPKVSTKIRFDA